MSKARIFLTLSLADTMMEFLQARLALSKQSTNIFHASVLLYVCFCLFHYIYTFTGSSTVEVL